MAVTALLVVLTASAVQPSAWLEVTDGRGDRLLLRYPLQQDSRWCVAWNHSVAGFTVRDCYRYMGNRMLLERSHQPDFAAGLGHIEGRGELHGDGQGGYWIEGIDEPVPVEGYLLRVGSEAVNHRLLLGDHQFSLSEVAAGERVRC